ncbi:MAG TPA: hypothetical protein VM008_15865 [Phycisphaerae bacterium]|nr:hypothetical protein [Phycisphaerae bacterium]
MSRTVRTLQTVSLALLGCHAIGQATTETARHSYTIGPETTIVSGPVNGDGTINYVQVINDVLSKGVTPENNAAIPLLRATTNSANLQFMEGVTRELKVTVDEGDGLMSLENFAAQRQVAPLPPVDSEALDKQYRTCRATPWKATDYPVVAEWLAHSERAFTLLDAACKRDRCFVPWVSKSSPPIWYDALPPLTMFRQAGDALVMRAMLNAGEGRLADSLADIKRARTLARFCAQQHTDVSMLVAVATENVALRGYEGLVTSGTLNGADLKRVREELTALRPLPTLAQSDDIEQFIGLDLAMTWVRGDYQRIIRPAAGILDQSVIINTGDLPKIDGDEFLRAVRREVAESERRNSLPFAQQMRVEDERIKEAATEQIPEAFSFGDDNSGGIKDVERFLVIRPGESKADFTRRIARWCVAGWPDIEKRMYKLIVRGAIEREIALLVVSLAEYRLVHGQYPNALDALGGRVLQDTMSGGDVVYRREEDGYVLYSVGLNQKDDGGTGDDLPVRAER